MCTPKFYAILKIYRMGDTLELLFLLLLIFFFLLLYVVPTMIIGTICYFAIKWTVDKFQNVDDPYEELCDVCEDSWCKHDP